MPITFDLLSLMPYLFTLFLFLGGGCIFALAFLAVLFVLFRRSRPGIEDAVPQALRVNSSAFEIKSPDFPSDTYKSVLAALDKPVSDLFPPNKIVVRCGGCGGHIRAGEGYSHYNVGMRKFFCSSCHTSKGLPLRTNEFE